ncbi:restriction endonuclease subunit S, partial [Streptococcus pneumoniae]|nr:restriction endonuclease subunit S [Streptococcus pneumoniae]MDS8769618.1 restriction endonuclease subunit S [Streptococcus pneumoniae]
KYKHLRINSGMVILRPKTPNLNQKFIIHVLRNNNYSRVISGSAQPQLPITKLKKILLPLPPLALQNEFADFVAQVDKSQFIIHVLRNNNYSRVISGSAQPQLPITKLKKILLPLPPLALQNEFADFVAQVDKSQFIIHVLRNNNYSRVISGSAQPQLPITKLKKILLPLPPLALQNEFADFVVQVDKSQLAIQKSLEELETLKKSLMQEYFG